MFGVLIESKASRQRRAGGALMSVLVHGALIAGAIVLTTRISDARPHETISEAPIYIAPPPPAPAKPMPDVGPATQTYVREGITVIIPPIEVPRTIPPITTGPTIDDPSKMFITAGLVTHDSARAGGTAGADANAIMLPDMVEKIATLRSAVRPVYPEVLRSAGVGGRVVVRFVVDTLGLVERETVVVREASHARFENAVREVLPRMRFTPAELNGHAVRMLVEMPFEFSITR